MKIPPIPEWMRSWNGPLTERLARVTPSSGNGQVPAQWEANGTARTICGFCSTGCSLTAHLKDGEAVGLSPDPDYPVNRGTACPKGWEALALLACPDRATHPWTRETKGAAPQRLGWDAATRRFVDRFRAIRETHGPDSVAFLSTGQIMTEEMAFLGALAKFGLGWRHGDGNTRQCMATAVTAYKESFGFDAPPFTYADFEESDVLVFVGANPCIAHPILWGRVLANRRNPEILVVDPRRTETAQAATRHYAPRPKSDLVLFYGLARILAEREWVDPEFIRRHTRHYAAFRRHLEPFTLEVTAAATGLSQETLLEFAALLKPGLRVSYWWTMGVNQSHEGTRTAQALINLALMTGNIGRPGTGANSITGQCNAMGSRLYSCTTALPAGKEFENPDHRHEVAGALGLDVSRIPATRGWSYDRILDGVDRGEIKGLWVIGTNPAHSWIDQHNLRRRLGELEFLVVQDMYPDTETAELADLFLPAAAWGEKEGVFINSERRIAVSRKVARAPGEALADFLIFRLIAEQAGCGELFQEWRTPHSAFQILKRLSAGTPCDMTGIRDYDHLQEQGGIQWPWKPAPGRPTQERRLFEDGRFCHRDCRARFCFGDPVAVPEPPEPDYPWVLITGRGSSAQWHTETRTRRSAILRQLAPAKTAVDVHPNDAQRLGLEEGQLVRLISRRGEICLPARLTAWVGEGQVFLPMHCAETNRLTLAVFDPYSRQPAYKHCAVRLEPVPLTPDRPGKFRVGKTRQDGHAAVRGKVAEILPVTARRESERSPLHVRKLRSRGDLGAA